MAQSNLLGGSWSWPPGARRSQVGAGGRPARRRIEVGGGGGQDQRRGGVSDWGASGWASGSKVAGLVPVLPRQERNLAAAGSSCGLVSRGKGVSRLTGRSWQRRVRGGVRGRGLSRGGGVHGRVPVKARAAHTRAHMGCSTVGNSVIGLIKSLIGLSVVLGAYGCSTVVLRLFL